jgi:hypothetical protein
VEAGARLPSSAGMVTLSSTAPIETELEKKDVTAFLYFGAL